MRGKEADEGEQRLTAVAVHVLDGDECRIGFEGDAVVVAEECLQFPQ